MAHPPSAKGLAITRGSSGIGFELAHIAAVKFIALREELRDMGITVSCVSPGRREFFERADMLFTSVGTSDKDHPAVANVRFDAIWAVGGRCIRLEEQADVGYSLRHTGGELGETASQDGRTGAGNNRLIIKVFTTRRFT